MVLRFMTTKPIRQMPLRSLHCLCSTTLFRRPALTFAAAKYSVAATAAAANGVVSVWGAGSIFSPFLTSSLACQQASFSSSSAARASSCAPDLSSAASDPTRLHQPDRLYRLLELELRAHDPEVLLSYSYFLRQAAEHLDIEVVGEHEPERHYHRFHVAKACFGKGKHRVQYERRTYFRVLELARLTGSTADTYLEYVQRMLPEAVAMKVVRHAREALPPFLCTPLTDEGRDGGVEAGAGGGGGGPSENQTPVTPSSSETRRGNIS